MSDLRTRLERLGDRARPAPDAFERLERTRRRRERTRRIEAGVMAFAIAIAGSIAVFAAFRDSEPRVGVGVEEGFFALWPETTYEDAVAEQAYVDQDLGGARAWRVDPIATAAEFAQTALGWGSPDGDGGINVEIAGGVDVAGPGPITLSVYRTAHGLDTMVTDVTMARLVRPDGIWSVVEVGSEVFGSRVAPGEEVAIDGFVAIPTTIEEGTDVAVGVAGTGSCSGFHEQTGRVIEAHIVVPVQGVGEGCAGYLYALTPSTPAGQVELGKIMFVYHDPKPALEYTIEAIVAVPVRFIASEDESPSVEPSPEDTLRVTCDRTTIEVDHPAVTAQAAGVHVVVENMSDGPLFFNIAPESQGPWGGTQVPPGITELALQAPPGSLAVMCRAESVGSAEVRVEVLDPQGLFVPIDLACPGESVLASTISVDAWQDSDPAPEPVEFVRSRIEGLRGSDVVERAGYPEAFNPAVRVVRDAAVVGSFGLYLENGEWGMSGTWCSGIGVTVPPGPDPYPRGAFEWCPEGPFGEAGFQWQERATEAAIQFVLAYVNGDEPTLDALLDPSVPPGVEFQVELAEGADPLVLGADARGGELVNFGCGNDVDAYTVAIAMDDGTGSASLDFTVYLVFRGAGGWKVWAVY